MHKLKDLNGLKKDQREYLTGKRMMIISLNLKETCKDFKASFKIILWLEKKIERVKIDVIS